MANLQAGFSLKATKGKDPATIDVSAVVPERHLPEWIGRFQKVSHSCDSLRNPMEFG